MKGLAGTRGLVRLILRRDRVLLPIWVLLLAFVPINFVSATKELYPTAADRAEYAETTGVNASFLAIFGPLFGADTGALVAQRVGLGLVILALVSLLTVIRHTRTEEEQGRRELLDSTAVGKQGGLAAALTVTIGANLVLALILALGMIGQDQPAAGAFALGLGFAATGSVFAAVGALAAQVTQSAGTARAIAIGVLGAAYVARMAGDVGGEGNGAQWLSWLSPIGWAQRIQPFAGERWWVLVLPIALTGVLVAAAAVLSARRDLGAGLVQPRLGPATAAPSLRGPVSLAWRLHRGAVLGWTVGFVALGAVLGGLASSVGELVRDNPDLGDLFTRLGGQSAIVDAYLAGVMGMVALVASAYGIQAALRLRSEESSQRAEPVLATPVSRLEWASGHLAVAVLGPLLGLTVAGLTAGLVYGLNIDDMGQVPRLLGSALVQLPAVWLLAAIAVAMFGLLPRFAAAVAWAVLAGCVLFGQFGSALQFDQWLLDLSPFTHIPDVPGGDVSLMPLIWLLGAAILLTAAGLTAFRRRDVPVL